MTDQKTSELSENYRKIKECVVSSGLTSSLDSSFVSLIAVTKKQPVSVIEEAFSLGIMDFGENYVQELTEKHQSLSQLPIRWHFIGHLQRNKVKYIAPYIFMIHSVDSFSLAEEISKQAVKHSRTISVLFQINTSGEESKSGVEPLIAESLIKSCLALPNIIIRGLMCLPEPKENPEEVRPEFTMLRKLLDEIRQNLHLKDFDQLSMGMSDDFEIAIQEGATMIRPGTALFGERS